MPGNRSRRGEGSPKKGRSKQIQRKTREEASQGHSPRETRDHNVTSQSVWPCPGLSDLAGASSSPRGGRWACSEAVFHTRWGDVGRPWECRKEKARRGSPGGAMERGAGNSSCLTVGWELGSTGALGITAPTVPYGHCSRPLHSGAQGLQHQGSHRDYKEEPILGAFMRCNPCHLFDQL